jgi:hypothetical protein
MTRSSLVDIQVTVLRDNPSDAAVLVTTDNENKVWLPRSEVEIEYTTALRRTATATMPEWMAIEKELV